MARTLLVLLAFVPLTLSALVATIPAGAQANTVPPEFVGFWEGVVTQTSSSIAFLVTLELTAETDEGNVGTIADPWCQGTLELVAGEAATASIDVMTNIVAPTEECLDGAILSLTLLPDGVLDYVWSDPESGEAEVGRLLAVPEERAERRGGELPLDFVGLWEGTAAQINPDAELPVELDLRGGRGGLSVGTITYPAQGCGGDLILRSVDDDQVELVEHLTSGADVCADAGTVVLTIAQDGRLDYAWSHPVVASPATGPLSLAPGSPVYPSVIRIPVIDVAACIEPLAIVAGAMEDTTDPAAVGWYPDIAWPGVPGNVVMSGAVDWEDTGPAVFWDLGTLTVGDGVELEGVRGERLRYEVVSSDDYDRQSAPIAEIVGDTGGEHVTLLTGAEPYDETTGEYERILVVRAERIADATEDEPATATPAGTPVTVEGCRD